MLFSATPYSPFQIRNDLNNILLPVASGFVFFDVESLVKYKEKDENHKGKPCDFCRTGPCSDLSNKAMVIPITVISLIFSTKWKTLGPLFAKYYCLLIR